MEMQNISWRRKGEYHAGKESALTLTAGFEHTMKQVPLSVGRRSLIKYARSPSQNEKLKTAHEPADSQVQQLVVADDPGHVTVGSSAKERMQTKLLRICAKNASAKPAASQVHVGKMRVCRTSSAATSHPQDVQNVSLPWEFQFAQSVHVDLSK